MRGSSPLARGLPAADGRPPGFARIIPARAGFTGRTKSRRCAGRDHPRSRGVYRGRRRFYRAGRGSSPLARGLRQTHRPTPDLFRIIPARAGFTGPWCRRTVPCADHPRSRGVYYGPSTGSSHWRGIIPARAGFTATRPGLGHLKADHPRSRGVYAISDQNDPQKDGSSPLARGLRGPHHPGRRPPGIIPARAGFTVRWNCYGIDARDHPRSRGVYPRCRTRWACAGGSSPLARGLRDGLVQDRLLAGIIPARAGFTPTHCQGADPAPDHPRSRGVYRRFLSANMLDLGSSPLARGLHAGGLAPCGACGIIPARAGFTTATTPSSPPPKDHPRSRGVYFHTSSHHNPNLGSSPLARGLLWGQILAQAPTRIIPARAGFTLDIDADIRRA